MTNTRIEKDSMGDMDVPVSALYGASTQRAVLNFPISGYRFPREFIRALGLIKIAAARSNLDLGKLDSIRANLIAKAATEVCIGTLDTQFPVDIFQTGSGTSTNMPTRLSRTAVRRWPASRPVPMIRYIPMTM